MIYVEFISRRPGVSIEEFHAAVKQGQEGWDASYGQDRLLLNIGRTWRLGPEPEYLGVWDSPAHGFDRIDDWDRIFREGHAEHHERVFRRVARIDAAGCFEALRPPLPAPRGTPYYVEYFRATSPVEAVARHYEARAVHRPKLALRLLIHRIGRLAPDPGGIAVWALPDFAALGSIAEELDGVREPLELVAAGTYADVGTEIL